mmetsp:Transcript_21161/g.58724  ORF Transcript_21161/g.58724 Transcript_21161/m.58724 type:complete len:547 (-) Transcript_21161:6435-8075(-)
MCGWGDRNQTSNHQPWSEVRRSADGMSARQGRARGATTVPPTTGPWLINQSIIEGRVGVGKAGGASAAPAAELGLVGVLLSLPLVRVACRHVAPATLRGEEVLLGAGHHVLRLAVRAAVGWQGTWAAHVGGKGPRGQRLARGAMGMEVAQAVVQLGVRAVDLCLCGVEDAAQRELDVIVEGIPVPLQEKLHGDPLARDAGAQAVHGVPPLLPQFLPCKVGLRPAVTGAAHQMPAQRHPLPLALKHPLQPRVEGLRQGAVPPPRHGAGHLQLVPLLQAGLLHPRVPGSPHVAVDEEGGSLTSHQPLALSLQHVPQPRVEGLRHLAVGDAGEDGLGLEPCLRQVGRPVQPPEEGTGEDQVLDTADGVELDGTHVLELPDIFNPGVKGGREGAVAETVRSALQNAATGGGPLHQLHPRAEGPRQGGHLDLHEHTHHHQPLALAVRHRGGPGVEGHHRAHGPPAHDHLAEQVHAPDHELRVIPPAVEGGGKGPLGHASEGPGHEGPVVPLQGHALLPAVEGAAQLEVAGAAEGGLCLEAGGRQVRGVLRP